MPQLILTQTAAGWRYTLDGRVLHNGDKIELVYPDGRVIRWTFAWAGRPGDPVLIFGGSRGGPLPDGVDVRWPVPEPVVRIERPHPQKPGREMTEYERRVLRHQAKPALPPQGESLP